MGNCLRLSLFIIALMKPIVPKRTSNPDTSQQNKKQIQIVLLNENAKYLPNCCKIPVDKSKDVVGHAFSFKIWGKIICFIATLRGVKCFRQKGLIIKLPFSVHSIEYDIEKES